MNLLYLPSRNGVYYYRRPVPKELQYHFGRREIVFSLKTKDRDAALMKYAAKHNMITACFRSLETGDAAPSLPVADARKLMRGLGLKGVSAHQIESGSAESIFELIQPNVDIVGSWPKLSKMNVEALAATIETDLTWEQAFNRFIELDKDHFTPKHDKRARDKRYTPRKNAIDTFLLYFPNKKNVLSLTRADAVGFRQELINEMDAGKVIADTANKKLIHLKSLVSKVFRADYPDLKNPFDDVSIKVRRGAKRIAFSEADISAINEYFESSSVSDELIAINKIAMNTGAHEKELVFLTSEDIHLDVPIPYISIGPNKHRDQVKSGNERHRDIPLVGEALIWAKKFPNGFPRYCKSGGADNLSAASNKHLKLITNKTFYGYRHRMADRLRNTGCQDTLKDSILGHHTPGMGMRYGNGYNLEVKLEALTRALNIV